MSERCMCGDPECPSCGTAMGTYRPRYEPPDGDELYEIQRQKEVDADLEQEESPDTEESPVKAR